jgi:hypothetical protein
MSRTAFVESTTRRRTTDNRQRDNRGGRNGGYRGNNNGRDDRPRGERKPFYGLQLFPQVTDQLNQLVAEGKLQGSVQGLLVVTPAELEAMGVENSATIQRR